MIHMECRLLSDLRKLTVFATIARAIDDFSAHSAGGTSSITLPALREDGAV